MSKINVCFSYPFVKPKEPANLVIFCEGNAAVPERELPRYLKQAMDYAKAYQVYLVPGRFVLKGRLCMTLLSPAGKPVALQKACHLNLLHHASLEPGSAIEVFDTELGAICLIADVDVYHPEVLRSAAMLGAETAIVSQYFDLYDVNVTRIMSGCWDMAQQNQMYVLGAHNAGCCVCAPCALTEDESGFLLKPQAEFPALATVYPHKLQKLREQQNLLSMINPDFCAASASLLDR